MIYTANYGGSSFSTLRLGPGGEVMVKMILFRANLLHFHAKVGDVVRVDNFPFEEEEECRDASHPHQTVVRGFFYFAVVVGFYFCVVVVDEDKVFTTR